MKRDASKNIILTLLACFTWFSAPAQPQPDGTNAAPAQPAAVTAEAVEQAAAEQALRSFLQEQEQEHRERLLIEQSRQNAASSEAIEQLAARLNSLEHALEFQRGAELGARQDPNRTLLIVASVLAGASLLTLALTSVLQWRTVSRFTEAASAWTGFPALPGSAVASESPQRSLGPATNARWVGVVERLEERVRELELSVSGTLVDLPGARAESPVENPVNGEEALLLGRAQALLNLGKLEEALNCYEGILRTEPGQTDALLGKGQALERLKRPDEAMECYERASGLNPELTRAWLCKASLLNQQERFAEALACYERALRLRESASAKS